MTEYEKALEMDAERMEKVMKRTAERADIWQDRFIYWMAVAIWHLIQWARRREQ